MPNPLSTDTLAQWADRRLAADDAAREAAYPGFATGRQPVHTVYLPADRFNAGSPAAWGRQALAALAEHGPPPDFDDVQDAVCAKLGSEPIEDLRIDFEDGYGVRDDAEEDAHAVAAAASLIEALDQPSAPSFTGIRFKCLEPTVRARGLRTLELVLSGLLAARSTLPEGFRLTLPKVTSVEQVTVLVELLAMLEAQLGLAEGALRFEIQIETPQAILGSDGRVLVAPMLHAAAGRCAGLHYGTYDYSASIGVAAHWQSMEHPVADHAKAMMQVAAAGTSVPVSDGSTNVLPVGDTPAVQSAWALHDRLVTRSLERGYYQGWDLHPAQLPTRYAANFRFFRAGVAATVARLQAYLGRLGGGVMDEPATAVALAGYLMRGLDCGAITEADIAAASITARADGVLLDRPALTVLARR